MVVARKRNRPPVPEPDPAREALARYLEEPTPGAAHEILGLFLLRERGWRLCHGIFLGGAAFAALAGAVRLFIPDDFSFADRYFVAKSILLASPFLGSAFWLRVRRRKLRRERQDYADAVADALTQLKERLERAPVVDRRLRQEALRKAMPYPRLRAVIEEIGIETEPTFAWSLRKRGWHRTADDSLK